MSCPDFTPLASVTPIPTAIFYHFILLFLLTITIGVSTLCVYGCAQAHTLDNMNCQNALSVPREASYTAKPVRNYMLCLSKIVAYAANFELTQLLQS